MSSPSSVSTATGYLISESDWYVKAEEATALLNWSVLQMSEREKVAAGLLCGDFLRVIDTTEKVISSAKVLLQQMAYGLVIADPCAIRPIGLCYLQLIKITNAAEKALSDTPKSALDLVISDMVAGTDYIAKALSEIIKDTQ